MPLVELKHDMDAATTKPRALVETVARPTRALDDCECAEHEALRRRAPFRKLQQHLLVNCLVRVACGTSRRTQLEAAAPGRRGDDHADPRGFPNVRSEHTAVQLHEAYAAPPPP